MSTNSKLHTEVSTAALIAATNFIFGTKPGGQGKTLAVHLAANAASTTGRSLKLVSVDSVDDGPSKSGSKLASILTGVQEISVSPKLAQVVAQGSTALAHWDTLGEVLARGGALIDVGGNVLQSIFAWARHSKCGSLLKPTILVVPVTRQAQSAADAVAIITEARQLGADLPIAKIVIAFNDVHGSTADAPGDAFDALRRLVANGAVVKCHIEKCLSEVWPNIESDTVDFARLAAMTPQEYSAHFGVSAFVGMRGANDFKAWRQRSMAALAEVLFPPKKGEGVPTGAKKTASGGFGS